MGLIRVIRQIGILNYILLLVAIFGIMLFVCVIVYMPDSNIPTVSDIADSRKNYAF